MLSEEPTDEDRQAGLTRRQIVMELDMATYRDLLDVYQIKDTMIPTRAHATASVSRTGWYT